MLILLVSGSWSKRHEKFTEKKESLYDPFVRKPLCENFCVTFSSTDAKFNWKISQELVKGILKCAIIQFAI